MKTGVHPREADKTGPVRSTEGEPLESLWNRLAGWMSRQQQVIEYPKGYAARGAPKGAPSRVGKYAVASRSLVGILSRGGHFGAVRRVQHRFPKPGVAGSSPAGRVGESAFLASGRPICFSPQAVPCIYSAEQQDTNRSLVTDLIATFVRDGHAHESPFGAVGSLGATACTRDGCPG